ncbi:MAG: hypothetical protein AB7E55_20005 [Pigmentiphaga sp.]
MEGFIIGGVVLAAILFLRSQDQETGTGAYAVVRQDSDDDGASDVSNSSLFDDDWPISSMSRAGQVETCRFLSDSESETGRWIDPMYAHEPDNIYHGTLIDPTYHDDSLSSSDDSCSNLFDDSFSSSSSYDDSFSSSSFDDSCSSSSFDDSFSSSSSFDD